jgi:hypothetical protein
MEVGRRYGGNLMLCSASPNTTYDAPKTNIAILIPCLVNCAKPVQPETLVRALDRTHTLLAARGGPGD